MEDIFSKKGQKSPEHGVHMTKVILLNDHRSKEERFKATKQKEIRGLVESDTWKVVMKGQVPKDAIIMGGRFVLAI